MRALALRLALVASALLAPVAYAADLPGDASATVLTFSVTGEAHAAPTLLTARLFAVSEGGSPVEVQKALNRRMEEALKPALPQGIERRAGAYSLVQESAEHGPARWQARQELTVSGKDAAAVLALTGDLQGRGLGLDGLDWSVDPAMREDLLRQARTLALEKLRREASESAATLGLHVARVKAVRLFEGESGPRPVTASLMMARMAAPPPQQAPVEQVFHVNAQAEVELRP